MRNYLEGAGDFLMARILDFVGDRTHRSQRLLRAARAGDLVAVQSEIYYGAMVNYEDAAGRTPLMCAAMGGNSEIIELLLKIGKNTEEGIEIDAANQDGATALMCAAMGDHRAAVDILLKEGAEVKIADGESRAALTYALLRRRLQMAALFLIYGCMPVSDEERLSFLNQFAELSSNPNQATSLAIILSSFLPAERQVMEGLGFNPNQEQQAEINRIRDHIDRVTKFFKAKGCNEEEANSRAKLAVANAFVGWDNNEVLLLHPDSEVRDFIESLDCMEETLKHLVGMGCCKKETALEAEKIFVKSGQSRVPVLRSREEVRAMIRSEVVAGHSALSRSLPSCLIDQATGLPIDDLSGFASFPNNDSISLRTARVAFESVAGPDEVKKFHERMTIFAKRRGDALSRVKEQKSELQSSFQEPGHDADRPSDSVNEPHAAQLVSENDRQFLCTVS